MQQRPIAPIVVDHLPGQRAWNGMSVVLDVMNQTVGHRVLLAKLALLVVTLEGIHVRQVKIHVTKVVTYVVS